jgi:4-hydroxy-tetrahydrodipicolinate synthase
MAKLRIEGSFVASITPFNEDASIDFGAFRTLIDFQRRHGTAAMLFMGCS